jgi:hypothetical protein
MNTDGMTVELFLEKIGKGCKAHLDKFPSWEELMTMKTREMKAKGNFSYFLCFYLNFP